MGNLVIRNARIKGREELVDILIKNGKIEQIEPDVATDLKEEIDAKGNMVTPSFVEPHIHLDNALASRGLGSSHKITLKGGIELTRELRKNRTAEEVKERAVEHIRTIVAYGVTKMRAIADVAVTGGLTGVEGLLMAKEECKDIMDMQIHAFPQDSIFVDPGTEDLLYKAVEMGADVIGGLPWFELSKVDGERHVDLIFKIAKKYDLDIDMHLDQAKDPLAEFLEYTAVKTIQEGYQGRVTAAHCSSLAYQSNDHARRVMAIVKKAGISICANASPVIQMGLDPEPHTRGITRVRELVDSGVNVTTASDTVCDGFHLYGTGDPLDYGLLIAYMSQYGTREGADIVLDMITYSAAKALRLEKYGIVAGYPADLNIIDAPCTNEALRLRPSRRVMKNGKVIAETKKTCEVKT
jgi:cytosine deaminase